MLVLNKFELKMNEASVKLQISKCSFKPSASLASSHWSNMSFPRADFMVEQTFVELYLGGGHWSIISKCGQLVEELSTSCHCDNWSTVIPPFSPSPNLSCGEVALLATYPDLT
jgi:hypothetical protein